MVQFAGTYKRTKEEHYEDFLNALGLNFFLRKAATISTPVMEITETSPGKWRIKTMTTLKTIEVNFKLGEPFDETFVDGREVTTTISQEGDSRYCVCASNSHHCQDCFNKMTSKHRWITVQKEKKVGGTDLTIVRDFTDEGINVEMKCKDVVSKQFFARQ